MTGVCQELGNEIHRHRPCLAEVIGGHPRESGSVEEGLDDVRVQDATSAGDSELHCSAWKAPAR